MNDKNSTGAENKKLSGGISRADKYGVDLSKSYVEACSANDCTGLIPTLPRSASEIESYDELYPFLPKANVPKD